MTFIISADAKLQTDVSKPGLLTVFHAFRYKGLDWDVQILDEGLRLDNGLYDHELLISRVQAQWAQIVTKVNPGCFGRVQLTYDRAGNAAEIYAENEGAEQRIGGDECFALNSFIAAAREDRVSFTRRYASDGQLTVFKAAKYFFDHVLKPHYVTTNNSISTKAQTHASVDLSGLVDDKAASSPSPNPGASQTPNLAGNSPQSVSPGVSQTPEIDDKNRGCTIEEIDEKDSSQSVSPGASQMSNLATSSSWVPPLSTAKAVVSRNEAGGMRSVEVPSVSSSGPSREPSSVFIEAVKRKMAQLQEERSQKQSTNQ